MPKYLVNITSGDFIETQEYRTEEVEADNPDHANWLAKLRPGEWVEELETIKID